MTDYEEEQYKYQGNLTSVPGTVLTPAPKLALGDKFQLLGGACQAMTKDSPHRLAVEKALADLVLEAVSEA